MEQQPVELILLKQWAEHMASSVWLMDAAGNLLYYNEPAETILGLRFDEAGEIHADQLVELFFASAPDGSSIDTADLPIVIALTKQQPAHSKLRIKDRSGEWKDIEVTALPVITADKGLVGALAVFWEVVT